MKVKELLELLSDLPLDVEVVFDSPDRDLWCLPVVLVESDKTENKVVLTSDDQ